MQKFSAIAILTICLLAAMCLICELPASGQVNEQALRSANAGVAVQREYRLTVNDLQRLYRQSTDGMAPSNAVTQDPATIMYSRGPVVPLSSIQLPDNMRNMLSTGVPTQGLPLTDTAFKAQLLQTQQQLLSQISDPVRNIPRELAQTLATQTMLGNSAAQVATEQANNAINYAGKYLINFTVNEGNVWNRLRNNIFVPIALLLLVPGTVLTQAKAIMAAGNPVIEYTNPFEGILRAIIAMCFIPGSYLVVNYGIDFSNSISHTIQDAYRSQFGGDMYADAFRAEQRAFPSRQAAENQNGLSGLGAGATATGGNNVTGFAQLENNLIKNKAFAADGTQVATNGLVDEVLPANAVAARMAIFGTNMVVTSVWDLLCAFQLVYLHYLFLVGPIMAAIWVYPIKQLREAWPNWVAGTITLCFWSLFWNTAILLMALFKDADSTGTFIMTALNLLATGSVKYAFDFVGLITEAGQEAAKIARTGKNEQGGNITPVPGTHTEKTKTFSENTKESGNGGLLGGITKLATTTAIGAALPGAIPALSLGSQLLGALGGGKDGGETAGMSDFAKSLSLPPMVSTVAENAFPASAAAFGIVGAAGLLGKEDVSLPPLAGGAKTGNALSALSAQTEQAEQAASTKKRFDSLNVVSETVNNIAEVVSGKVDVPKIGSLTAASGLAGLANSDSAATAALTGTADSVGAAQKQSEVAAAAAKQQAAQESTKEAMRALIAGSVLAAANRSSSREVQNFMGNLAQAAGLEQAAKPFETINTHNFTAEAMSGPPVAASAQAAAMTAAASAAGLPPSARVAHAAGSTSGRSASSFSRNNLFREGSPSLETESARELSYEATSGASSINLFREVGAETISSSVASANASSLNFSAAPPLAFASTSSHSAPPPMASALAKMAIGEVDYVAGEMTGLVGFAEAVAPQITASEMCITEVDAIPVVRDRERLFRMAIEAKVEAGVAQQNMEQSAPMNAGYEAYLREAGPDQNEKTSGVLLSLAEVQAVSELRRPRGLQELMKRSAFERPCDTCKNTGCQCAVNAPVAAGVWS
jgi:hypothetical protein